jgi:hypothetical protein
MINCLNQKYVSQHTGVVQILILFEMPVLQNNNATFSFFNFYLKVFFLTTQPSCLMPLIQGLLILQQSKTDYNNEHSMLGHPMKSGSIQTEREQRTLGRTQDSTTATNKHRCKQKILRSHLGAFFAPSMLIADVSLTFLR